MPLSVPGTDLKASAINTDCSVDEIGQYAFCVDNALRVVQAIPAGGIRKDTGRPEKV